jgi:hypothetical protein
MSNVRMKHERRRETKIFAGTGDSEWGVSRATDLPICMGDLQKQCHRLFFLLSRQEVLSRAFVTVVWFNDFVSGPPLKFVKKIVTYLNCLSDVID